MKKFLFFLTSFFSNFIDACPTCVGQVTSNTVPFFSEDFYKPGKQTPKSEIHAVEYGKKELQKLIDDLKGKK